MDDANRNSVHFDIPDGKGTKKINIYPGLFMISNFKIKLFGTPMKSYFNFLDEIVAFKSDTKKYFMYNGSIHEAIGPGDFLIRKIEFLKF